MNRGRSDRGRHQRRRARDEAVESHRHPARGAAQDDADQAADLEATDLRQHVDAVVGVGPIQREGAPHGVDLAPPAVVIHAGAASGNSLGVRAGDRRGDRARRRRVADAHLTGRDQIGARIDRARDQPRTALDRGLRLRVRHGGTARHVRGAGGERTANQLLIALRRAADRVGHTKVRDDHARRAVARKDIDRGAAADEVLDHLRGHRLRIGAHALRDDAVIRGEGKDHRLRHARRRPPQREHPHSQLLEPTQAAGRLRQRVEMALGLGGSGRGRRDDRLDQRAQAAHRRTSFTVSG